MFSNPASYERTNRIMNPLLLGDFALPFVIVNMMSKKYYVKNYPNKTRKVKCYFMKNGD